MTILSFGEWAAFNEMAARRSFTRSLGKFIPQTADRPVATLTAWRGELFDPSGKPYPEAVRRKLNSQANFKLMANIRRRGLSYYPVFGAGQEAGDDGGISMNRECSLVVQPMGRMSEGEFLDHVKQLLFNPTGERGPGPFSHSQWGAVVKLPDLPEAFLLHQSSDPPRGAADYRIGDFIGGSAGPRRAEPAYTQMKFGPRAAPAMTDPFDHPDDLGNIKGQPGRRFTVRDEP